METDTTKTLAQSQAPVGNRAGFNFRSKLGSVVRARENGGNLSEKPKENLCNESKLCEDGEKTAEEGRMNLLEVNHNRNENEEDGEEEENEYYVVGDLVWGKIKGYPWWPGQLYHPSHASVCARKYNQRERLLVAYFGDRSFSWCHPSQLKPFAEYFEEMSKQNDSKSFLNAVQKAVEGIGRLVELKLTCSCVPDENRVGLARSWAENAGIKQGVLVPEWGPTSRISIARHGPVGVIAAVKYIAEVGSTTSMLDLTVLTSFLSVFYRAKGGHKLAVYQEPLEIEQLEDKDRNGVLEKCRRRKKKGVAKPVDEHKVIEGNGKTKRKCGHFASLLGRKRGRKEEAELSGSPNSTENEVLSAKHGNGGVEEAAAAKQDKVSSIENADKIAEEGTENVFVMRAGKRIKYLSSLKIAEPLGERKIRVVDQLIGSPPIVKCSGETFLEKLSNEFYNLGSLHPPGDWKKITDSMEIMPLRRK